jgi:16S rRNA (adenine1518-N6/adenine1519-N6)-dimethyltransferase
MKAKKYLGQHFLQNKKKLERIVGVLDVSTRIVIEIGPGRGDLTRALLRAGFFVYAIEKDADLVLFLKQNFADEIMNEKLKVIEGDALAEISNYKLQMTNREEYSVVGNIPYYITGQLFRVLEELPHKPKQTVLLVQKEVATRACARAGETNILSASIGWWADAKIITTVPRTMFNPPPKVDSAVVSLETRTIEPETHIIKHRTWNMKHEAYFKCIHMLFKQPRKTIVKNLVDGGITRDNAQSIVQSLDLPLTARPHDLSIDQIKNISVLF